MNAQPLTRPGHHVLHARVAARAGFAVATVALFACRDSAAGGSSTGQASDSDVVAVLPFAVPEPGPALLELRDAIHDLVADRLSGGDGVPHALDPTSVRAALDGGDRAWTGAVPIEREVRVAAGLGATQLLRGTIAGSPQGLTVEATLVRVPEGTVEAQARAESTADSLPHLADRLIAHLLAAQTARDSDELAALAATSLPALRAYLAGRQAYRRGKLGVASEATRHFERALFLDSTFALAGLRIAEIASRFGMSEQDERWKLDAIWRQRGHLGPADRALLDAYLGPDYPRRATLAELLVAGERATRLAPNRSEAWHIAGVYSMRFGPRIGYPGWEARADQALQRALALDSTEVFPIQYLQLLAAVAGDRAAVRRYAEQHRAAAPVGGQQTESMQWVAAVVLGDSAALAELRARIPEMTGVSLQMIVEWSQSLGAGVEDAGHAARAFESGSGAGRRRNVIVRTVPFLMNRGHPAAASRLLATAERGFGLRADVGVLEFKIYAALYWDGDSSSAAAAARSLEAYLGGAALSFGQVRDRETATCALAHWWLGAGDLARADAALGQLRRLQAAPGSAPVESTPVCAAAAEALLAATRQHPDAAGALERLDALLAAGSDVQQLLPTVATVIAARLYEARGDFEHALALMRRRTFWYNWLLSTPLREEGRLATMVGDTAGAIRAYRHYLALRSEPEPQLRPGVERVRAELQRLLNPSR